MIVAHQVIHQVQEGTSPATWWVVRPFYWDRSRAGDALGFIVGMFSAMFLIFFGPLIVGGIVQPELLHRSGAGPFGQPLIIGPVVVVSLAIAVAISIFLAKYIKRSSDAFIALLPEGVVSCERCSDEAKRSITVIEYAHVTHMALGVEHSRYWNRYSLAILYREGIREKWCISLKYSSPETIAQRVITDHLRFTLYPSS